ncbi:hypothetical protein [Caproicibacter sp.]|uniref:hypothetical protein n=1 Tax=Caproicibacter sp. TaxID=2814884 RepID=UPI003988CD72
MENIFKQDKYTFKELPSQKGGRTYRVKCVETGEEKDSFISYTDAAGLLISTYNFADQIIESNSQNKDYIEKIFHQLLGKKKSQCSSLVREEIAPSGQIQGVITQIKSDDKLETKLKYQTEYFDIQVLFENGLMRGATKIEVTRRND